MAGALTHDPITVGGGLHQTPSGGVQAGPDGVARALTASQVAAVARIAAGLNGTSAPTVRKWIELLSCQNEALWDDRAGAGMTVSVDASVLFDGKPTLRLDIPAGSSGTYRVGTTAAVVIPPYNWDGKQFTLAVMSSNMTAVSASQSFLGDVAFANYYTFGGQTNSANVPEAAWVANEWMVGRGTSIGTGAGAPTFTGAKRLRINFTVASVGTATSVWIGFCGIAAPKKTTVVLSIDDGYASGYSFVAPVSRYYKIPVSFGIDRAYTGTANYMTAAQIQELHADTSDLFEFVAHGYNNGNVSGRGDTQYVQDNVDTRAFLRGLGINGDGPNHHPWVQSLQTNAALAGMKAAGFLSARMGAVTPKSTHDSHFYTGQDKRAYQLVNCTTVTTGVSLATAQAAVSSAVTEGYGVTHVNAHDFRPADAASPPTWSYDKWVDLMGWLDAQRTAGSIEIKTWGRWYADLIGTAYAK